MYHLEADSSGISLLFDNSHVIKTVPNYFKNTLVGGGCSFVDVEVLIFFKRGIMRDKINKNTLLLPEGKFFIPLCLRFCLCVFNLCLSVYFAQILTKP